LLSDEEFKAAIGSLKKKAFIEIKNGKVILSANKSESTKKMVEESFLESLPLEEEFLQPEQKFAFQNLQNRKNLVEVKEDTLVEINPTTLGKELMKMKIKEEGMIEQISDELLKGNSWKGKKFRRYDVTSPVPLINGGKRHFVNQTIDSARKIWIEMGFKEMSGNLVQTSFWNFDALFTPQDHSARELQDTFFIDKNGNLPDDKLVKNVKNAHEKGVSGIIIGMKKKQKNLFCELILLAYLHRHLLV